MNDPQYGAHELLELHEVLNASIDAVNLLQAYLPYVRDPHLKLIVQNQNNFLVNEYNQTVQFIHGLGAGSVIPYRGQIGKNRINAVASAETVHPNSSDEALDDRDVASAVLGLHKANAKLKLHAALECTDAQIRGILLQGANNCAHQAYEVWEYMNNKGYYRVPILPEETASRLFRGYATANPGGQTGFPSAPQAAEEREATPVQGVAEDGFGAQEMLR